jgi:hypothetical protein
MAEWTLAKAAMQRRVPRSTTFAPDGISPLGSEPSDRSWLARHCRPWALPVAAAEVSDSLTVLFDARGRALTKSYALRDGRLVKQGYPDVAEFRAVRLPFSGFDGFAAVLEMVVTDGRAAVIRAEPGRWYPADGGPAFRLLGPQPTLVYARSGRRVPGKTIKQHKLVADGVDYLDVIFLPTLEERARAWAILDIDRPAVPPHLAADWVDQPEEVVEHVLELLPEPCRPSVCSARSRPWSMPAAAGSSRHRSRSSSASCSAAS